MTSDNVLNSIKQTLGMYMSNNSKAYLYGSRARGDNRPNSDWDILLLLDDKDDEGKLIYELYKLGWSMNEEISPVSYQQSEWEKYSFTPFFHNVKEEGIQIYGT